MFKRDGFIVDDDEDEEEEMRKKESMIVNNVGAYDGVKAESGEALNCLSREHDEVVLTRHSMDGVLNRHDQLMKQFEELHRQKDEKKQLLLLELEATRSQVQSSEAKIHRLWTRPNTFCKQPRTSQGCVSALVVTHMRLQHQGQDAAARTCSHIAVVTPIRSTTRSETPSSDCTRSPDDISTNGFSSKN
ncbi:hypothetical protein F511_28445 [Dorcoceras hygrometricum]|uniref:Uncharacterized protein n=1 Tax=Dorcoceras hygrometricum TaxID=472368 RepID=A0A2Z7AV89_9LAMI|nr:hypothetical protein F511_28445 [Dorcoceras hygrometricum]